jgi:hypothetical protein
MFPLKPLFILGIFHGYVSHNQMVNVLIFVDLFFIFGRKVNYNCTSWDVKKGKAAI